MATIADTFTRADSSTSLGTASDGGTWTVDSGTFGISSNTAYFPTQGTTGPDSALGLARRDTGQVDADVTFDVVKANTIGFPAIWLAYDPSTQNGYSVRYRSDSGFVIRKVTGGSGTTVATVGSIGTTSVTVRVTYVSSTGVITVYKGGVSQGTYTDGSPITASSSSWVGFSSSSQDTAANQSWDNFSATASGPTLVSAALTANRSARSFTAAATAITIVSAALTANRSARSFTANALATDPAALTANRDARSFTATPIANLTAAGTWNRSARAFGALVDLTTPLATRPTGWRNLWRVSPVMPAPTLDSRGLPVNWTPTSVTVQEWGYFAVFSDFTDVTTFRDVPTLVEQYESTQPFGDSTAVVRWPQITPFDDLASLTGPVPWMDRGVDVKIVKVNPAGTRTPRWCGFVLSLEHEVDETSFGFAPHLMGNLYGADLQAHQPPLSYRAKDIGYAIYDELNTAISKRYSLQGKPATGITTRQRGDRGQTRLTGYVQDLLGQATTTDGLGQWTVNQGQNNGPVYYIDRRDMTTVHATLTCGTPGLTLALSSDLSSGATSVYGRYVRQDGGVGQNTKYPDPTNLDSAFYRPLAFNSNTQPQVYDSDGNVTGFNSSYDPDQIPVDRYEDFGEGLTYTDANRAAQREINDGVNVGWFGTMTLKIDPEEMSRFDLRAGMNVLLKHYTNRNLTFHISRCVVRPVDGTVELTVDTKARDLMTLTAIIQRSKAAALDPVRRMLPTKKRSKLIPDVLAQWDADAKTGLIGNTSISAGWNVLQVPASQFINVLVAAVAVGTGLRSNEIATATSNPWTYTTVVPGASEFSWGVFGKPITVSDLNRLVGNPLDVNNLRPWNTEAGALIDAGIQFARGGTDGFGAVQAAGYWPGDGAAGDTKTGKDYDSGGFWFESFSPPWMWFVIYVAGSGNSVAARFIPGVND